MRFHIRDTCDSHNNSDYAKYFKLSYTLKCDTKFQTAFNKLTNDVYNSFTEDK